MGNSTVVIVLRWLMPLGALLSTYFIYQASQRVGGKIGEGLKILMVGTVFLTLYGLITSLMSIGIIIFSFRDSAWPVGHALLHLTFSIPIFVGMYRIRQIASGDSL